MNKLEPFSRRKFAHLDSCPAAQTESWNLMNFDTGLCGPIRNRRIVLRQRPDRVVQQVSTQPACLSFESQRRMDHSGKACLVSPVEPSLKIRIPSRMMDPRAKIPGEARHFVN